jgi:hypothetical protein
MNLTPKPDVIDFDESLAGNIELASPLPLIHWNVVFDGQPLSQNEQPDITVRGEGEADSYRIFEIAAGATVTIKDLKIANGLASEGGGIKNSGTLTLANSVVQDNVAAQLTDEFEVLGGGIANLGTLTVTDFSRVQGNRIMSIQSCVVLEVSGGGPDSPDPMCPYRFSGAGIFNEQDALLEVTNGSVIEGNFVCHIDDDCFANQFPNNAAEFTGGGIFNNNGNVVITESTIRNNEVRSRDPGFALSFRGWGGAIHSECRGVEDCLTITYSTLSNNVVHVAGTLEDPEQGAAKQAVAEGGAIAIYGEVIPPYGLGPGTATIVNSTITGNRLDTDLTGSGCVDEPPAPNPAGCEFAGAAIWFKAMDPFEIRWTTIEGNKITFNHGLPMEAAGIHASETTGWE